MRTIGRFLVLLGLIAIAAGAYGFYLLAGDSVVTGILDFTHEFFGLKDIMNMDFISMRDRLRILCMIYRVTLISGGIASLALGCILKKKR